MSTTQPVPSSAQPAPLPDYVELGSPKVVVAGVDERLMQYAHFLGALSKGIFGLPIIITSGKDSIHVSGSKHMLGQAIDIRTKDKTQDANSLLASIIRYTSPGFHVVYFDETALGDEGHIHLEKF